ncbi:DNA-binding transcriptional regulator [Burkholderia plantarii]|uniref:DNA-binding transcriptional regulator n=1 Tax=Burkholderia plantarii TaxID=41899 RepID=UPI0006D8A5D5|nr:DNA-binding transcriptional regulator [Burkholderia plantarii]ALK33443.1 DNA-binding transcriptional activator MhpR [Burkholderia plantarii]GLZ16612.1 IclR family transcriptional regulator [Burkholderia plantarii]
MPERDSSIRAVERAIALLRALNQMPVSTLDSLHQSTSLPKPTLIRLLRTFEELGLVARGARPGEYRLLDGVNALNSGYHHVPRVVEIAAPLVRALTEEIKWPIAVAMLDVDALVVRYSTIPYSPLSLLHSSINMRLSLVARAIGRAYLAFCSVDEQEMLLEVVRQSHHPEDALAHDREAVRAMLDETRRRGYALRDAKVRPVSGTLAVPVMKNEFVVASIGLTWFSSALTVDKVVERYLGRLLDVSRRISEQL